MKNDNCPYVKISQVQADILAKFSQENSESFLLKNKPQEKKDIQTFASGFSLVSKAHAQGTQSPANVFSAGVFDSLTFPFYILFGSFFLFIILMSFVYFYHWKKFTMNDPFINSFIPVYFFGLVVLILPILYNLF